MTSKDTNFTLGEESTFWLMYTLENYLTFNLLWLFLLTMIILYFPIVVLLSVLSCGSIFINICKIIGNLPVDPDNKQWRKPMQIYILALTLIGKVLHGKYDFLFSGKE